MGDSVSHGPFEGKGVIEEAILLLELIYKSMFV